uniref:Putative WW-binding domain-containing protein n=1 Tax=Varanus komodoensis TaxID=61221 RepID=A0A8D2JKR2_VARKO
TRDSASEFSSFLFWRTPLPSIEEDLRGLLVRAPPDTGSYTEEDGGDGAGRREPPAALLPEPKGLEPTRTPGEWRPRSGISSQERGSGF